jgi:hypothetical protein
VAAGLRLGLGECEGARWRPVAVELRAARFIKKEAGGGGRIVQGGGTGCTRRGYGGRGGRQEAGGPGPTCRSDPCLPAGPLTEPPPPPGGHSLVAAPCQRSGRPPCRHHHQRAWTRDPSRQPEPDRRDRTATGPAARMISGAVRPPPPAAVPRPWSGAYGRR